MLVSRVKCILDPDPNLADAISTGISRAENVNFDMAARRALKDGAVGADKPAQPALVVDRQAGLARQRRCWLESEAGRAIVLEHGWSPLVSLDRVNEERLDVLSS